jgi:hypothetical protein
MYKIEISKVEQVNVKKQSYEKVAETGNKRDSGPVFEYVPFDTVETRETNVLTQQVEDLDLAAVIKAINKL